MAVPYLKAGFDPTADPNACVTRQSILDMIEKAVTQTDYGWVVYKQGSPDAVTDTEFSYFLWLERDANGPTGRLFYYNGSQWSLVKSNAELEIKSVDIEKLLASGGQVGDILVVNSESPAGFNFSTVIKQIAERALPQSKLVPGAQYTILFSKTIGNSTTASWGDINEAIPDGGIQKTKIQGGTNVLTSAAGVLTVPTKSASSFEITLTENITQVVLKDFENGDTVNVMFKQPGAATYTVAWGTSEVKWPYDETAPTLTALSDYGDLISFTKINGIAYGTYTLKYKLV